MIVYGLRRHGGPIRYIGQTKYSAEDRLKRHRTAARGGSKYPVHLWIAKHTDVEVVVLVSEAVWNTDEVREIAAAKKAGLRLLNCTEGGGGISNPSVATRRKISNALTGRKVPVEQVARMRSKLIGVSKDNGHLGMVRSAKTREKLSGSKNGMSTIDEQIARNIKKLSSQGFRVSVISAQLGISYGIAHAVVSGRSWSHVDG